MINGIQRMKTNISTITTNTRMKWHSIKLSATCFRNISNKQIRVIKLQKQLPWNILYVKIINVFKKVSGKFTEERYRGVIKHNYLNAISRSESLNH